MSENNLDWKNSFGRVLNGKISKKEEHEFEKWLSMSDENQSELQQYKEIWESSALLKKRDIDIAKLKTEVKILKKLKKQKRIYSYLQKAAAVLFIPILFISIYLYSEREEIVTYSDIIETVRTPLGARTSLTLPDSSIVWLNAGSEISFPHNFKNSRELELKGEIFIEVKKSNSPFTVKTKYGDIKVLGTKFDVSAYEDEPFKTTLLEGSVLINDKSQNNVLTLEPGFQAVLNNNKFEVEKVVVYDYISWKDGKLEFKREPFINVAKKLERWFNVTIELEGDEIKNLWYTGTIEMESFSEVLQLIKNTTPIEYSFNSKTRILNIKSKIDKNKLPM